MFKDTLKEQQPIVYQTLLNAINNKKLAHAYLFHGSVGTPKKETAYLLAQSLICDHEGFACETCDTCMRVIHQNYADLIYIDGSLTSIKKDEVLKLQHEFNKTSLESNGYKIYMIDHVENATPDALNSLLKFLEEPTSKMMAILISEQLDRVLPTIVSRCQIIPFKALSFKHCYEMSLKSGINEFDAYTLSNLIKNIDQIKEASEDDAYQHACYLFKESLNKLLFKPHDALLFLQIEGFQSKNKQRDKKVMIYLFDMYVMFYKDCLNDHQVCKDHWYQEKIEIAKKRNDDFCELLNVLMKEKDKVIRTSINMNLLLDQTFYQIKEVMK